MTYLDFRVGHAVRRALFPLVFGDALGGHVDLLHGFHQAVAARLRGVVERQALMNAPRVRERE